MPNPEIKATYKLNSRIIPAVAVLSLITHLIFPGNVWIILIITFGGLWLLGWLWVTNLAQGLHIKREHRFGWNQVGDLLEERFTLSNSSLFPAPWLLIEDLSNLPGYSASQGIECHGEARPGWFQGGIGQRRSRQVLEGCAPSY